MTETMRKRDEALREAARMWQRGNSKSRGGEVAFYFAERVRGLFLGSDGIVTDRCSILSFAGKGVPRACSTRGVECGACDGL